MDSQTYLGSNVICNAVTFFITFFGNDRYFFLAVTLIITLHFFSNNNNLAVTFILTLLFIGSVGLDYISN